MCLCAQILILGCYIISIRALEAKDFVYDFGTSLCKFRPHFWETFSESPKNRNNGNFCRNFYIEIMCLCMQIHFSEGYIISGRSLDPKDFVNRFVDSSRNFNVIFSQVPFWTLKTAKTGDFWKVWTRNCVPVCVHILILGCVELGADGFMSIVSLKKTWFPNSKWKP